nr:mmp20 [Pampus argenteus]
MPGPCFTAPTLIPEVQSSPSTEPQVDLKLATEYLQQYYHLQEEPLGRMKRSGPSFTSKVKDMQIFFGINVTGVLDSETLNVMKNPRCGVPDVEEYSHTQGTRWNKNVITYRIRRYTRDLPRTTVDSLIESAFSIWARASSLTFVKSKTNNADIVMEFVTNQHGDLYPFDGPRGTLAHAFGPGLGVGGDTHFDDAEHWTAGETGFNLFVVAAHEIGHALGLKHSRNPESLMYPNYKYSRPANLLSREDVVNINALYSKQGRPNSLSRYGWLSGSLFPQNMQDKCAPDVTFDAVSTLGDATFFFRERYLWIKHNEQYDIKEGPITNFMPKIETSIDAAFWVPRRSTAYLIHESVFWTVKGSLVKGKARALSHFGFPAWVQDVDAAVHIVKTGRTLFFMHDIYWSYNENRRVMDSGYPKYISEGFPGLNTTINAAIHKEVGSVFISLPPLAQGLVSTFTGMPQRTLHYSAFISTIHTTHCHSPLYKRWLRRKHFNKMSLTALWIVLLGCLAQCHAAPTVAPTVSPEDTDLAEGYLSDFYTDIWMGNSSVARLTNRSLSQDLETMQAFFGLEVTGVLNAETLEVMKAPRCGVSDISRYGHFHGKPRWQKRLITYRITRYTPDLAQSQVDATIAKAFQLYSDVIPLDFKQIYSGTADIMILFKGGPHGDFYPFDGRGGVLAHANSPGQGQGGDTHFDDDETWTLTQRGVNLLLVAAHEFGHALGLDHSRDRRALMYPTYQYVNTNGYRLPDDDKRGVQALYGSRTVQPPEPKPKPPPTPEPEPEPEDPDPLPSPRDEQCSRDLVFDAATSIKGDLFFFKNGYYWRKSTTRGLNLIKVSTKWSGINHVDAAFEVPYKDVVYLFEDRQYWGIRAYTKRKISGYPKSITTLGLPSSVSKVDAAVYVAMTRKTLIFVKNQYWSYDEVRNQMDVGYPRYITWDFPGIGSKVDAVFENYGYLYFSNGPRQIEYDLAYKTVRRVLLNYGWLNCY